MATSIVSQGTENVSISRKIAEDGNIIVRRTRRRLEGCAAGLNRSSIGRQRAATARARTRRAGAAISKIFCPSIKNKVLRSVEYDDEVDRKTRKGLRVNNAKRPG